MEKFKTGFKGTRQVSKDCIEIAKRKETSEVLYEQGIDMCISKREDHLIKEVVDGRKSCFSVTELLFGVKITITCNIFPVLKYIIHWKKLLKK